MCACALGVYGEEQREERNSSDSEVFLEHMPLEVDGILCCGREEQDLPHGELCNLWSSRDRERPAWFRAGGAFPFPQEGRPVTSTLSSR